MLAALVHTPWKLRFRCRGLAIRPAVLQLSFISFPIPKYLTKMKIISSMIVFVFLAVSLSFGPVAGTLASLSSLTARFAISDSICMKDKQTGNPCPKNDCWEQEDRFRARCTKIGK